MRPRVCSLRQKSMTTSGWDWLPVSSLAAGLPPVMRHPSAYPRLSRSAGRRDRHSFFGAISRAFNDGWSRMRTQAMAKSYSWQSSGSNYLGLYQQLAD